MRVSAVFIAVSLSLTVAAAPQQSVAQDGDFVFTDAEGHLILRYAGAEPGALDADRFEEIVNVSLSTMVHDRLRADAIFEAEPVDSAWAGSVQTRITRHVRHTAPEFSAVDVECRSASCRLVLEHASTRRVSEHRSLMAVTERVVQAFIDANPSGFDPVFLMAAHYQEPETPYMKVFLRRAAGAPQTDR